MSAIRGLQLSQSYRHYQVLKDVSFEVASGECYALFGPNGAGKTTLLKVLATLQKPSSGRFELLGFDGIRDRNKVRAILLMIAHGSYLYNELDAVENIRFAVGLRGLSPTAREIKVALDRVGIGAFADFKIRYFSEGMKKRLSIAKAMLIRPKVLLMDEPYSSLDERGITMMNHFIRENLEQGAAVLMTSHNRVHSAEVAGKAGVLHQGVLREIAVKDLVAAHELF
ncbi:MAG TPA: heme ABC exporter ATP-binding protein CcmA [Nitrospiria bacterium]|jgi:heme ABC exporter ATP-binding subunit CcmA|nr:heme ABC exporter ATP-binding protein CcmA [Nitrospiria bacterium]